MSRIISMQDIRESLASIADRARAGESFVVVRNSKPAFRIVPVEEPDAASKSSPPSLDAITRRLDKIGAQDRLSRNELDQVIHEIHGRRVPD